MGLDKDSISCYTLGVKGNQMKKTLTATATISTQQTQQENHWMSYKDAPATLNLEEFSTWLLTTNPSLALSILMSAVENNASLPSEFTQGKLVEVSVFDEEGTALYNLTESGERVYEQTIVD